MLIISVFYILYITYLNFVWGSYTSLQHIYTYRHKVLNCDSNLIFYCHSKHSFLTPFFYCLGVLESFGWTLYWRDIPYQAFCYFCDPYYVLVKTNNTKNIQSVEKNKENICLIKENVMGRLKGRKWHEKYEFCNLRLNDMI